MNQTTKAASKGRTPVQKLARLLQYSFPTWGGHDVEWLPSQIFPATGWHRSSPQSDCYRWVAFCKRPNGGNVVGSVGSYDTIKDLIRYTRLSMQASGEVAGVGQPRQRRST